MIDVVRRGSSGGQPPQLAIYIGFLDRYCHFYTINGAWAHRRPKFIKFAIQNAVSPTIADSLRPYMPSLAEPDEVNLHPARSEACRCHARLERR